MRGLPKVLFRVPKPPLLPSIKDYWRDLAAVDALDSREDDQTGQRSNPKAARRV